MSTILITGANKGLGHEAARRLLAAGHDVWIGARDPERGRAAADDLGARHVLLDVTDQASVDAALATVTAGGGLDVLVNNAGVSGGMVTPEELSPEAVQAVLDVNVLGPVRMLQAFLPLLRASDAPVVVNVSSGLGSQEYMANDPIAIGLFVPAYSASKAALNMLTTQMAKGLPEMRINAVDPGYTATEFNGHSGPQTVEEGTDQIVAMATIGTDGPTGTYTDRHGALGW